MFKTVYKGVMKRKHGKPMTFAQSTKKELRDVFGPQWIAHAAQWILIACGLFLIGMIGIGVLEITNELSETLEGIIE